MKAFHVICGLPRSGSTLLCNILAQNPALEVLHTSPLAAMLRQEMDSLTNVPEVKGLFERDPTGTDVWSFDKLRGGIERSFRGDTVAIDKNRLWNSLQFPLEKLFPNARMLVMRRDLRAVFGSVEKQWRRNPLFQIPPGETTRQRMRNQFSPDGMIGSALEGIDDLYLHRRENVRFVSYEALCENPKLQLQQIYDHLGEPYFDHDFDKIKNTATDPDWLYLGKFPHRGEGKLKKVDDWGRYVPEPLASEIMANNGAYNQTFGYV
ncbi:MAG: sulfotransferase family protein [Geminicoccaceae bacterium]